MRCSTFLEKPKNFIDQTGAPARDAHGLSGLGKILTGKSCGQQIGLFRKCLKLPDVPDQRNRIKLMTENTLRGGIPLAKQHGFVTMTPQTQFDSSNPRKEGRNFQGMALGIVSHG